MKPEALHHHPLVRQEFWIPEKPWVKYGTEGTAAQLGTELLAIGATKCHDKGIRGQGIDVAVIDIGFGGLDEAKAQGYLPADTELVMAIPGYDLADPDTDEVHGTAVAEIVHRTAPEARIHLIQLGNTEVQLPAAVAWCIDNGIDVISTSWAYFNKSFYDGTGPVNDQAVKAWDSNIVWVTSSGNYADGEHFNGTWKDADGDRILEFEGDDENDTLDLQGPQGFRLLLTWDDRVPGGVDLDVCWTVEAYPFGHEEEAHPYSKCSSGHGKEAADQVDFGFDNKYCETDPDKYSCFKPKLDIWIRQSDASAKPAWEGLGLSLFVTPLKTGQRPEYWQPGTSLADPACAGKLLTVGAIHLEDWNEGTPAPYSSFGPTAAGVQKPELAGPDGVWNFTLDPFFGTSAATPYASGLAALVVQEHPEFTPFDVKSLLVSQAVPVSGTIPDPRTGHGRLFHDCAACEPDCDGIACGPDPVCGMPCGACSACGETCVDSACTFTACEGRECGDDGCGGSCGSCTSGQVCVGTKCCTRACDGKDCGDDGCGGTCGECTGCGEVCGDGLCRFTGCDGMECGDDGCGGSCGSCKDDRICVLGLCVHEGLVVNTPFLFDDDGKCTPEHCSLREAIEVANTAPGADFISFKFKGTPPFLTSASKPLPPVTDGVVIDATTLDQYVGEPLVVLEGHNLPPGIDGFEVQAGGTEIRGFVIQGFTGNGIHVKGADKVVIRGNRIGIDAGKPWDEGNGGDGILVEDASDCRIGGTSAGAGNVVSGNKGHGIRIAGKSSAGNEILGNLVGLSSAGDGCSGNGGSGVRLESASDTAIGGAEPAMGNVVSCNGTNGIGAGEGSGTAILGNRIGTDPAGTQPGFGNQAAGVAISGTAGFRLGGSVAGEGNVISGNGENGVSIVNGAAGWVRGNLIGLDAAGEAAIGNDKNGIEVGSIHEGLVIGGSEPGAGNVISGNASSGIQLGSYDVSIGTFDVSGVEVEGNRIGTDVSGTKAVGNGTGIRIHGGDGLNIGGKEAGEGNLVSGNLGSGIEIATPIASVGSDVPKPSRLKGNRIGTDAAGMGPLGNGGAGIRIDLADPDETYSCVIGGKGPGEGNLIAFNGGSGISMAHGDGCTFSGNAIHSNAKLGIDLGNDGPTPNDAGDLDKGPNGLQNFPEIVQAATQAGKLLVKASIQGVPDKPYGIEIFAGPDCDESGYGEGRYFLGHEDLILDLAGKGAIDRTFDYLLDPPIRVTLTATDNEGNTSEFSRCVQASCLPECTGRECGDDACGGSCGDCGADEACGPDGKCACLHAECGGLCCAKDATCFEGACCTSACAGRECGNDGCGGSCGACGFDETCGPDGKCSCLYAECLGLCCTKGEKCFGNACCTPGCAGRECGDDGCGGSCGICAADRTCQDGRCIVPGATCPDDKDCSTRECGPDPVCGEPCGTCGQNAWCGKSGVCTCYQEAMFRCGVNCCVKDSACFDGQCCARLCIFRECGDDGCGGSCGTCPAADKCRSVCRDGSCGPEIPEEQVCDGIDEDCDGQTDEDFKLKDLYAVDAHCGACGNDCTGKVYDNAAGGRCKVLKGVATCVPACEDGFGDADHKPENGCECVRLAKGDSVGDGIDQDCDGIDGTDNDWDGHASEASGGDDCDDVDDRVHPGAPDPLSGTCAEWRKAWIQETVPLPLLYNGGGHSAIDDRGNVHVCSYATDTPQLLYTTNASGKWVTVPVEGVSTGCTALAVDDLGRVAILSGYNLVSNRSGKWTVVPYEPGDCKTGFRSMAMDAQGGIHLAYSCLPASGWGYGSLVYLTDIHGFWEKQTVTNSYSYDSGYNPLPANSIAVGPAGEVFIAATHSFYSMASGYIEDLYWAYREKNGTWVYTAVDKGGYAGKYNAIVVDRNGAPHICYNMVSSQNDTLRYASKTGEYWKIVDVETGPYTKYMLPRCTLGVDSLGTAHIAYYSLYQKMMKYAENSAGTFKIVQVKPVTSDPNIGLVGHLASGIDHADHFHVMVSERDALYRKFLTLLQSHECVARDDGTDSDCDGRDGVDADKDGSIAEASGGDDCDDGDAAVHPGAADPIGDGIDSNCDGADGIDADSDGHATDKAGGDDCDDSDASRHPGALDLVGDGIDQNCDGVDGIDGDRDGHASKASGGDDCDDARASVFPGAVEACDGLDNDCDGTVDEGC